MITRANGFDLHTERLFPDGRRYAFVCIALLVFLLVIYSNSFRGAWQFDDTPNIVENRHIALKVLDRDGITQALRAPGSDRISRPLAYLTFALNYRFGGLDPAGYHAVNFIIHYLTAVFLFLFLYNTLRLPAVRDRYGPASYGIALLATFFWAASPVQVTAVTYIVQRMASMGGLFYIMALYFYLAARTAGRPWKAAAFGGVCLLTALAGFATKENVAMLPVTLWLFDLLLIQGATRENIKKNIMIAVPAVLLVCLIGIVYRDVTTLLSGYENRPFTLTERLLTEPRIIILYITLLLYPVSSRLMLLHDIELSRSLFTPWTTLPSIALIVILIGIALYLARRRPLISFSILFFFLNHLIEGSVLPLELIYEHRNYIPSMLFFVPVAVFLLTVIDYFSYRKALQWTVIALVVFLLAAQGHTVFVRNALFEQPLFLWFDNAEKTPALSRPHNNLGAAYWNLGSYDKAYEAYATALSLGRQTNRSNRGVNLYNLGMYHFHVKGDMEKALGLFRSAMAAYPGYWPAHHDYAVCLIRKGDMAGAKETILATLSSWPDNARFHHTLGYILLREGHSEEAIRVARRALALDPELSNPFCVLGEAFRQKGAYGAAIFYWNRYREKHPDDMEGNLALVELYARQGDRDALARTVGRLLRLKGSKSWDEVIGEVLGGAQPAAYRPDPAKLKAIIAEYLKDEIPRSTSGGNVWRRSVVG